MNAEIYEQTCGMCQAHTETDCCTCPRGKKMRVSGRPDESIEEQKSEEEAQP